eukprot:Opistho-1_new@47472
MPGRARGEGAHGRTADVGAFGPRCAFQTQSDGVGLHRDPFDPGSAVYVELSVRTAARPRTLSPLCPPHAPRYLNDAHSDSTSAPRRERTWCGHSSTEMALWWPRGSKRAPNVPFTEHVDDLLKANADALRVVAVAASCGVYSDPSVGHVRAASSSIVVV